MTEHLDSYKSLILFMLDTYAMDGAQSVSVWQQWDYDWDKVRAAGFSIDTQDDQFIISWDNETLKREAASVGYMLSRDGVLV